MENNKSYLLFTGYHDVAAASEVLKMYNIDNRIVKAPISMRRSCAFAVVVDVNEGDMSKFILDTKGIKPL